MIILNSKKFKAFLTASFDGGSRYPGSRIAPGVFLQWQSQYNPNLLKEFIINEIPIKNQNPHFAMDLIREYIKDSLGQNKFNILFGGDHSITVPSVEAFLQFYNGKANIIIFDAHDDFDGSQNTLMNWNILNYLLKMNSNIFLLGVRLPTPELYNYSNLKIYSSLGEHEIKENLFHKLDDHLDIELPTYISLDLDVFNLYEFPGVSNGEPGGMSFNEIIKWLHYIFSKYNVKFIDIVEFNPTVEKEVSLKTLNTLFILINRMINTNESF